MEEEEGEDGDDRGGGCFASAPVSLLRSFVMTLTRNFGFPDKVLPSREIDCALALSCYLILVTRYMPQSLEISPPRSFTPFVDFDEFEKRSHFRVFYFNF